MLRRTALVVPLLGLVAATVTVVVSAGGADRPHRPPPQARLIQLPTTATVEKSPQTRARKPPRSRLKPPSRAAVLTPGRPNLGFVEHGPPTARRLVALTFDADMTPLMLARLRARAVRGWYDRSIVSYLRATRTPATVFLTGLWARTYPGVVRSLAHDRLFELENHSYDHSSFEPNCYGLGVVAAPARKRFEIADARAAITAAGAPAPRYFRFPGGCHSAADLRLVASEGERPVGWDVVSGDPFQPSPAPIVRAVEAGTRPGSIVVMHIMGAPNAPATSAALRQIVPALRGRGFRFATLRRVLKG